MKLYKEFFRPSVVSATDSPKVANLELDFLRLVCIKDELFGILSVFALPRKWWLVYKKPHKSKNGHFSQTQSLLLSNLLFFIFSKSFQSVISAILHGYFLYSKHSNLFFNYKAYFNFSCFKEKIVIEVMLCLFLVLFKPLFHGLNVIFLLIICNVFIRHIILSWRFINVVITQSG